MQVHATQSHDWRKLQRPGSRVRVSESGIASKDAHPRTSSIAVYPSVPQVPATMTETFSLSHVLAYYMIGLCQWMVIASQSRRDHD